MAQQQTSPWAGVPFQPDVTQADMAPQSPVWASAAPDMGAPAMPDVQQAPVPKIDLHKNLPQIFAPAPDPAQAEIKQNLQGRLERDYEKDANPMGSANNHPGFFGKLAHGLSHALGGDTRRQWEEQGLAKNINEEMGQESLNQERGAQTAHAEEETAEAPAENEAREGLENEQTENMKHPSFQHIETDQGIFALNPKTNELIPLTYQGQPLQPHDKPGAVKGQEHVDIIGPDGKAMVANYHPDTGQTTDASGKVIPNPRPYEKPNQAGMVTMIVPDPNTPGGGIVERLGSGSHVAPGAQTAAGVNAVNTPTTTQRTAAGRAETVVAMAPQVISEINAMGPDLGPVGGRWNDFMQGKMGTNDPRFAGLRADLLMMSSAVALAHAQGRLPENLREEFDHAINAPQQTAGNLTATIQHMLPWLQQMQHQGQPNAPAGAQQPIVQHSPSTGQYRYSTDGGKTWQSGQPQSQR